MQAFGGDGRVECDALGQFQDQSLRRQAVPRQAGGHHGDEAVVAELSSGHVHVDVQLTCRVLTLPHGEARGKATQNDR